MKRIVYLIVLLVLSLNCKAQAPDFQIEDLYKELKNNHYTLVKTDSLKGYKCEHFKFEGKAPKYYTRNDIRVVTFRVDPKLGATYGVFDEDEMGLMLNRIDDNASASLFRFVFSNGVIYCTNIRDFNDALGEITEKDIFLSKFPAQERDQINTSQIMLGLGTSLIFPDGSSAQGGSFGGIFNGSWKDFVDENNALFKPNNNLLSTAVVYFAEEPKTPCLDAWRCGAYNPPTHSYTWGDVLYQVVVTPQGLLKKRAAHVLEWEEYDGLLKRAYPGLRNRSIGDFQLINNSDTIVSVEPFHEGGRKKYKIKYKNGDNLIRISGNGGIEEGSIHRNGGTLIFKNKKNTLVFPDGSYYEGSFGSEDKEFWGSDERELMGLNELTLWNGVLTKADGTKIGYRAKLTDSERAAIDKAYQEELIARKNAENEEAKKKQEEAKKRYNELCDKYGRKYVDAIVYNKKPVIGMPEELFKIGFIEELAHETGYSRAYRVRGVGISDVSSVFSYNQVRWTVWVTNGVISEINYWN